MALQRYGPPISPSKWVWGVTIYKDGGGRKKISIISAI